jgi:hypothetical protein
MTALDHRSEAQTEMYLDKDRDRRDLATMLDEMYGQPPAQQAAGSPEQAIAEPPTGPRRVVPPCRAGRPTAHLASAPPARAQSRSTPLVPWTRFGQRSACY